MGLEQLPVKSVKWALTAAPHGEHSALCGWFWRETQAGIQQMEVWMNLLMWSTCLTVPQENENLSTRFIHYYI